MWLFKLSLPVLGILLVCILADGGKSFAAQVGQTNSRETVPEPSCTAMLHTNLGAVLCFNPSSVGEAEARAGFPLVRPTFAVKRAARLRLTQVLVLLREAAPGMVPRPYSIHFIYGSIPHDASHALAPWVRHPVYILVSEFTGRVDRTATLIERSIGMLRLFGASDSSGLQKPWELEANLPGRQTSLFVNTNISRKVVQAVGASILSRSAGAVQHPQGESRIRALSGTL